MYQIWRIYLDLWGHDCKKWVWSPFGCKLGQSDPIMMQLKLDMSCPLLNVVSNRYLKACIIKSWKRGRTDGQCHGIIRPFFKQAYKKTCTKHNLYLWWYFTFVYRWGFFHLGTSLISPHITNHAIFKERKYSRTIIWGTGKIGDSLIFRMVVGPRAHWSKNHALVRMVNSPTGR